MKKRSKEESDEFVSSDKQKHYDHLKEKRIESALKRLNVEDLMGLNDDDYFD